LLKISATTNRRLVIADFQEALKIQFLATFFQKSPKPVEYSQGQVQPWYADLKLVERILIILYSFQTKFCGIVAHFLPYCAAFLVRCPV